jgi:hypothetical protein
MSGTRYLTEETLDQYLRYVTRWKKAGRPRRTTAR